MPHDTFSIGDLTVVIGDNSAHGDHRAGYNGIWELRHRTCPRPLFVPGIAGLNFEHIFSGEGDEPNDVFFEPRKAPMSFRKIAEDEAELHQPPTPTWHLESWTRFKLAAPHFIDMHFRCIATQHVFHRGYIGLFWASYIHAPEDKSIYFPGSLEGSREREQWTQLCSQRHNLDCTVRHRDDKHDLAFAANQRLALYKNLSPLRFDQPFYYGRFDDHLWAVFFDRSAGIRFTHSPSGGGADIDRKTTNPAWDFQFVISPYEVNVPYEFRARAMFRPKCSRAELAAEYDRWRSAN